ncbi:MAG: hypothetical protein JWP63_3509, partial [Candidatus Solibacter sp.]|nr:hypothetical protein [Candidatus Solibacter sp.]
SLTVAAPIGRFVCVLLMLFTGLMFVPAVVKYHVWSIRPAICSPPCSAVW